jgi:hypothetical protein
MIRYRGVCADVDEIRGHDAGSSRLAAMASSAWIVASRAWCSHSPRLLTQRQRLDEPLRFDEMAGCGDG